MAGPDGACERVDRERIERVLAERNDVVARRVTPLEAGLGHRRFYRIELEGEAPESLVARVEPETAEPPHSDAPHAWLPEPRLEPLRGFLEAAGLPVPRSYAHVPELGVDLLEDVGAKTLASVGAGQREERYLEAAALVPRMQRLEAPPDASAGPPAFGRVFDRALVRTKAWKLVHWGVPGLLGRPATPGEREAIETAFEAIASWLEEAPRRLAHRDFKAENLHLVRRRGGREELVMIDVQGAFLAPPEYDLVCLLRDLQVDLEESLVQRIWATIRPRLPDPTPPELAQRRFDALAVVRLGKDLSHVVHAARARDDWRRWHEIPRGLALLSRSAGALEPTFPWARALTSVIDTLTRAVESSDIARERQG